MVTLEPSPATDLTSMVPPIWSILVRTTSMPTPRPDTLVTAAAVEKPGAKMNLWICASVIFSSSASLTRPLATALALIRSVFEPAAVVGDADDDVAAFVIGGQPDRALLRLASSQPLGRRLQPVIGRVAHHMGQRILDQIEHLAVELGVGAVHLQFDLLAQFAGQIAHDPRQLLPGIADRLHPRLHDAFLQFGGDVGQPLQRHLELGVLVAPEDLQELVAGQHQLRHHRHQMFQRVDIDADRLVGDAVAFGVSASAKAFFATGFGSLVRLRVARAQLGERRRRLGRGLAERPLQFVERHFAGTQRPLQHLIRQRALRHRRRASVQRGTSGGASARRWRS